MSFAHQVTFGLLGAVRFLTVIPVPGRPVESGQAALFFPLVGAGLGCCGAAVFAVLARRFSPEMAALATLAFWVAITGGLHEDGLADVADAFGAGRPPERILEILKDSRIGTFGAAALFFSLASRWQALARISSGLLPALVASQAVSRAALVALARMARPAGGGLGTAFSSTLSSFSVAGAVAQGAGAALLCGPRMALWILLGSTGLVILARSYFHRRIGGITGDCLGAASQAVEVFILVLLSCRP